MLAVIAPDGAAAIRRRADPDRRAHLAPSRSPPDLRRRAVPGQRAAAPARPQRRAEGDGRTFVSPVVARIAAEHGVDPTVVPGTGRAAA